MKIRLNDKTTLAFIKSRVDPLATAKNGKRKYLSSVDAIFKDLFEKKGIGTKIIRCTSYRELYELITKIDGTALFEILRRNATYKNLGILIKVDHALEKGDLSKKEEKKLSKLRAEGIKVFIDNFDIRRAKDDNDFSSLKSYVKKSKRSFDDDDFDFSDSLFDDDFDDDDYDDDEEEDLDAFEAFASKKTKKKSRVVDDDDGDEEEDKIDKLIELMTRAQTSQIQAIQKPVESDLDKKLTNFAELVDKKFTTQEQINEKFADALDAQDDRLDYIIDILEGSKTTSEAPGNYNEPVPIDHVNPLDDMTDEAPAAAPQSQQGQIYRQKN